MLLNLSNHPVASWSRDHLNAAEKIYGKVIDIEFPQIAPSDTEAEILKLSGEYASICINKILESETSENAVHIMGELTFCFSTINILLRKGIKCIASTTERQSAYNDSGEKISRFEFKSFREYIL